MPREHSIAGWFQFPLCFERDSFVAMQKSSFWDSDGVCWFSRCNCSKNTFYDGFFFKTLTHLRLSAKYSPLAFSRYLVKRSPVFDTWWWFSYQNVKPDRISLKTGLETCYFYLFCAIFAKKGTTVWQTNRCAQVCSFSCWLAVGGGTATIKISSRKSRNLDALLDTSSSCETNRRPACMMHQIGRLLYSII